MDVKTFVKTVICAAAAAFCVGTSAAQEAAEAKTVIACVGDSITQGAGAPDQAKQSYPAQLQGILGDKYQVLNFGVGGRTLCRKADPLSIGRPLRSSPNIVIIMLGTNDSKPYCWDKWKGEFVSDYTNIINQFKALATKPEIYVCLPPPAFPGQWGISQETISKEVIPAVKQVAEQNKVKLIDMHTPLLGDKALFPDRVHPNPAGYAKIAKLMAEALKAGK